MIFRDGEQHVGGFAPCEARAHGDTGSARPDH